MALSNIAFLPATATDHETLDALTDRYKTLRLRALKEDPEAFSSEYDDEVKFPRERWQARIQNPSAHTLIALEDTANCDAVPHASDDSALPALLSRRWLGTLTMIGPKLVPDSQLGPQGVLNLFNSSHPDSADSDTDRSILAYALNGMHISPEG